MAVADPLIALTDVHKSFGATHAVDGLTFAVPRG